MQKLFKSLAVLALALTFSVQGFALNAADKKTFEKWLVELEQSITAKSDYKKLPIQTQAQSEELLGLLFLAYTKEISLDEFKRELNEAYPGYVDTVNWLAAQLNQNLQKR